MMMNPFFFLRGGALIRDLVLLKVVSRPLRCSSKSFFGRRREEAFPGFRDGRRERERERERAFEQILRVQNPAIGIHHHSSFEFKLRRSNSYRVLTTSRVLSVLPIII